MPLEAHVDAADAGRHLHIHVKLDISHHGGSKGKSSATRRHGSLEITASFVAKLLALGVAGYPTVSLTRRRAVELSAAGARVLHDSQPPAFRDRGAHLLHDADHCPDGQTCQNDTTCK